MASLTNLATSNLALKGAGTTYNYINRFFATKAEADAALADSSWTPVAGRLNAALTGDQGLLVYNESTQALDLADTATRAYVDAQLAALTGDAPALLNTLGEISDALNDDPDYFNTAAAARAANTAAITAETTRATTAETAIQADVDQNEADADAAIAANEVHIDNLATLSGVAKDSTNLGTFTGAVISDNGTVKAGLQELETKLDLTAAGNLTDLNIDGGAVTYVEGSGSLVSTAGFATSGAITAGGAVSLTGTTSISGTFKIGGTAITATADELNYVDGVTSNVQTQLDAIQADVNQNESDADAAIAAVQADVDQNEADADAALATKAPLASPALTGTPTAPTASQSAGTTQIATTAYVDTAVANLIDNSPGALDTLKELADALGSDANFSATVTSSIAAVQADVNQNELDADSAIAAVQADVDQNEADADAALALKAPLAGPVFTGVPAGPTAAEGTNTGQLATTAFVTTAALAAEARNEAHIDNVATLLGIAKDGVNFGTFSGSTVSDNQTLKTILQALETSVETKFNSAGGTLTGSLVVHRDFPDLQLKSNQEKRLLFTDAGGGATGAIKNVNSALTFFAGGVAGGNLEMTVASDGVDVSALKIDGTAVTATAAELNYVDGVTSNVQTQLDTKSTIASPTFTGTPAAPTASAGTNTTQIATTAFVTGAVSDLVDGAPGAINTLNELAAALGDDANFSTTVTNSIAANEVHIDNVATLLGIAKDGVNFGAFSGSTIADNQTLKTILQALETDTESRLARTGGTLTGNLTLRKSDGSAVALVLSRADHADMSCTWKIQPSYVSSTKEVLTVLANGQVVAHFDERQRFAINMNDPDYTLDVGGDGHFSTNLVVDGTLTLGSTAITATAAELNILDGVTSTAAELNILDGVTATAAELNALDGITATVTELNYTDGVTSNIQTQLDAKLAAETITLTAFKAVVAASSDFGDFQTRVAAL